MTQTSRDTPRPGSARMNLNPLLQLPEDSEIANFAEAQVHLYRHDVSLHDYFLPLQLGWGTSRGANVRRPSRAERASRVATGGLYRVARPVARPKYKADVLFCPMPYFQRPAENRFLVRTLIGLARTGATVLCLLPDSAPCRPEVVAQLEAEHRQGQVTLLDPTAALNPVARALFSRAGRYRGRAEFLRVSELLRPLGLEPPEASLSAFEHVGTFVEAWRAIEDRVDFGAVVARCHWGTLCSPVCRTAQQLSRPVITFQQGVIDQTLDVPVTASQYVSFGECSAVFLAEMNRQFFETVGKREPPVEFIPSGSLFDTVLDLRDQFAARALLVVDNPDPKGFYGLNVERCGVLPLIRRLLRSRACVRRVVIRLHPYWEYYELESWKELVREFPDVCELSSTAWTLEDDLRRSSVAIGNFCGSLTVAAASGLPTFFVETDRIATRDLACFRHGQTFSSVEALREIRRVLADQDAYTEAQAVALRNARDYYAGGVNAKLDGPFFERMLRVEPALSSASIGASG